MQASMISETNCIVAGDLKGHGIKKPKCLVTVFGVRYTGKEEMTQFDPDKGGITDQFNEADELASGHTFTPFNILKYVINPANWKSWWKSSIKNMMESPKWEGCLSTPQNDDLKNRLWYARFRHAVVTSPDFEDEDRIKDLEIQAKTTKIEATATTSMAPFGDLRRYIEEVTQVYEKLPPNKATDEIKYDNLLNAIQNCSTAITEKELLSPVPSTRRDMYVAFQIIMTDKMASQKCTAKDHEAKWGICQALGRQQHKIIQKESKSRSHLSAKVIKAITNSNIQQPAPVITIAPTLPPHNNRSQRPSFQQQQH